MSLVLEPKDSLDSRGGPRMAIDTNLRLFRRTDDTTWNRVLTMVTQEIYGDQERCSGQVQTTPTLILMSKDQLVSPLRSSRNLAMGE